MTSCAPYTFFANLDACTGLFRQSPEQTYSFLVCKILLLFSVMLNGTEFLFLTRYPRAHVSSLQFSFRLFAPTTSLHKQSRVVTAAGVVAGSTFPLRPPPYTFILSGLHRA